MDVVAYNYLKKYQQLEEDLLLIASYVELDSSNDSTYSHKIANLLCGSAVAFESVCKAVGAIEEKKLCKISQYKSILLDSCPVLEDLEVIILLNKRIIKPFENWSQSRLGWWDQYSNIKHDYFNYFSKITLIDTINAVGALSVSTLILSQLLSPSKFVTLPSVLYPKVFIPKEAGSKNFLHPDAFISFKVF
jgi:hypothetical protein